MQPRISVPLNGKVTLNTNKDWVRLRDVADGLYINIELNEILYYYSQDDQSNLNPRDWLKFTFTDESKAKFTIQEDSIQHDTSTQQNRIQGKIGERGAGSKGKSRHGR
jgi:uncharacterized protein YndB with AHSA1/START domain